MNVTEILTPTPRLKILDRKLLYIPLPSQKADLHRVAQEKCFNTQMLLQVWMVKKFYWKFPKSKSMQVFFLVKKTFKRKKKIV